MSLPPNRKRRDGLSRREFVQGRFWRVLGLRPSLDKDSTTPARQPPRRVALVMRYPRTLGEVVAGDAEPASQATAEPMPAAAARRRTIPVLRPPGAIEETSFLENCTRCNECVTACPHDAITHAPDRLREAAGTPIIDADRQACMMCDDFPCITACQPGVLSSQVRPMMGTAKVTEHLCLAHHGTICTVCSERCPVEQAIEVIHGKPTVNEHACTGCGVCRYVCPAPENAILLMPAFLRPSVTEHQSNE